jgi:hypothetical protein
VGGAIFLKFIEADKYLINDITLCDAPGIRFDSGLKPSDVGVRQIRNDCGEQSIFDWVNANRNSDRHIGSMLLFLTNAFRRKPFAAPSFRDVIRYWIVGLILSAGAGANRM